jgi:hypothetical protein
VTATPARPFQGGGQVVWMVRRSSLARSEFIPRPGVRVWRQSGAILPIWPRHIPSRPGHRLPETGRRSGAFVGCRRRVKVNPPCRAKANPTPPRWADPPPSRVVYNPLRVREKSLHMFYGSRREADSRLRGPELGSHGLFPSAAKAGFEIAVSGRFKQSLGVSWSGTMT